MMQIAIGISLGALVLIACVFAALWTLLRAIDGK